MRNPYLGEHETSVLIALIASVSPQTLLEFGTNLGITANAILKAVPSIQLYIGVDVPFAHTPRLACQRSEVPILAGRYAEDPRYRLLIRESTTLTAAELEPVDAVFIDGDHSAVGVAHDSELARELLRPGGIIVWHDYTNPAVEVTQVIDQLIGGNWPIQHFPGTWLAYMRSSRAGAGTGP